MYKVASDRRQSALHRGRLADWTNGKPEVLSPAEQLRQLQDASRILHDRILALPKGEERKKLGLEKFEIQQQLTELKKQVKDNNLRGRNLNDFIVNAAKEILSKSQFNIIFQAAVRDFDANQKANPPLSVIGDD